MTKEEKREYQKQYRKDNADKIKQYRKDNADKIKERSKQYCKKNAEKRKQYHKDNATAINQRHRQHYKNNTEKVRNRQRQYETMKMATDPIFKLKKNLRIRLYNALKRNTKVGSAVSDLGCTVQYFKDYIASKFEQGMTWENQGEWHLDHIIPLAAFDLTQREQLLIALNYSNYQPLWSKDNMSKNDTTILDYTEGMF